MKNLFVFSFVVLSLSASAQRPKPYIEADLNLNSGGYAPVSQAIRGGLMWDSKRFLLVASASYDNVHKSNDGTDGNVKGRERCLEAGAFYKVQKWYLGGGIRFGQTATTNYTKQSYHPEIGVGRDWFRGEAFSARGQAIYLFPARNQRTRYPDGTSCRCSNDVQGIQLDMWLPSPATRAHLLFHQSIQTIFFHTTVTSPSDLALTRLQQSQRSVATFVTFGIIGRF